MVLVPAFSFFLPLVGVDEAVRQKLSVATSLAATIPTSLLGARAHWRHGVVDVAFVRGLAAPILIGSAIGSVLAVWLGGETLSLIFAALAFATALLLGLAGPGFRLSERFPERSVAAAIGVALGLVAALMGIGGGTVGVPVMVMFGVPILRAVGAASVFGLVIAVPGTAVVMAAPPHPAMPPFSLGYVSLPALAVIVPFAMLATGAGARFAHRLNQGLPRRGFAVLLVVVAARMAATALG